MTGTAPSGTGPAGVGSVSPRHRPPLALRALLGLVAVIVLLANAAVLLSDRAPGVLRRLGGRLVVRLSERIDAGNRVADAATDPRLPQSDTLVHIGMWAVAAGVVGLAIWTWRGLLVGSIGVLAASVFVELGQARWSHTRAVQASDLRANIVGVMIGAAFAAVCYLAWSAVAGLITGRRRNRTDRFAP